MSLVMITGLVSSAGVKTNNVDDQNYGFYTYASTVVKSYLNTLSDGSFERVEYDGTNIIVEIYDDDYKYVSGKTLTPELELFGGYYYDGNHHYIVTGQNNEEEDETKEVFRITVYDSGWNRIGSDGLFGANTVHPFRAGSLRFAQSGKMLYLLTAHEMYADDEGTHHQANVYMAFNTETNKITDSFTDVLNIRQGGYVSHSMNQFIICDNGKVATVNHGDAGSTRGIMLLTYPGTAGDEVITSQDIWNRIDCDYTMTMSFASGLAHYNYTGCDIGGFEASASNYLIAGNSIAQDGTVNPMSGLRNIFLTVTPKSGTLASSTSTVKWFTNYVNGTDTVKVSNPQFVKINNNKFLLMWNENQGGVYTFKYCFVDGSGNKIGSIYTSSTGRLSDCKPIVAGNKVVWYTTSNSAPGFYEIDLSTNAVTLHHEHSYTIQCSAADEPTLNNEGTGYLVCDLCGFREDLTMPALSKTNPVYTYREVNVSLETPACGDVIYYFFTYHHPQYDAEFAMHFIFSLGEVKQHNFVEISDTATCTEFGELTKECTICGSTLTSTSVPTGHNWSDWTIVKTADCVTRETKQRSCSKCGEVETEEGAYGDHVWDTDYTIDIPATCYGEGSKSIHCKNCDSVKDRTIIPVTDHVVTDWVITEGSCEEGGTRSGICVNCGQTITLPMDPVGHQWTGFITDVEATCLTAGSKSKHCTNCGAKKEVTVIPPNGHSFGKWEVTEQGTCVTKAVEQRVCEACGETEIRDGSYGDHLWDQDYTIDKTATCIEKGSKSIHCAYCDATKNAREIPFSDHNYGDWTASGNTLVRTCSVCGDKHEIERVYGSSRYDTSIASAEALKKQLGVEKFENIVVASGTQFPDALAGSYLAVKKNAPVILVADGKGGSVMAQMTDYIKENLADGGTVYVLGGEGAVSPLFEEDMGDMASAVKRIAGNNRYETNILILEEAGVTDGEDVLVCTGMGFADSLGASATGRPILLVPGSRILDYQEEYLNSLSGSHDYYIIGGEGAVGAGVENALYSHGHVRRLAGVNRYETSALVADAFFEEPDTLVMAYGQTFPDGLSAGPLAAACNAPLVLCANSISAVAEIVDYRRSNELPLTKMFVTGGPSLISDVNAELVFEGDK